MVELREKMSRTLFVYGTLMGTTGHPMAQRLASRSRLLGTGSMAGKLFSLGSYPGVIEDKNRRNRVHGEVVQLASVESFTWLDDYEGCGPSWPKPHDYERKLLPVRLYAGMEMHCWVYIYKQSIKRLRRIPHGRFRLI